jgi:NAD(P)H-flavin reductase
MSGLVQVLRAPNDAQKSSVSAMQIISVLLSVVPFIYLVSYYPIQFLNQKFTFTDNYMELYMILVSFLPLFIIAILGPYLKEQPSDIKILKNVWVPRFKGILFENGFESLGDVLVLLFVVVSSLIWWTTPLLTRVVKGSLTSVQVLDQLAASAGIAGMNLVCCTIFFAIRENVIARLWMGSNTQYHQTTKYHVLFGYASFIFLSVHSLYYVVIYARDRIFAENIFPWVSYDGAINFAGVVAWFCLLFMATTGYFRSSNYQFFLSTHQLYILFFVSAFIHYYLTWYPVLGMLIYFVYDRMVCYTKFPRSTKIGLKMVGDYMIRMDLPVGKYSPAFPCKAGDWVYVTIPSISHTESHPFSIANAHDPQADTLHLYVRVKGNWTKKVRDLALSQVRVGANLRGPFGSGIKEYMNHSMMLFIVGGTGMSSIVSHIHNFASQQKKALVYWSLKSYDELLEFEDFLTLMETPSLAKFIHVTVHVTKGTKHRALEREGTVNANDEDLSTVLSINAQHQVSSEPRSVKSHVMVASIVFGTGTID